MKHAKYTTGKIKGSHVDLDEVDFAVDTAGSWDGEFSKIGKGDYIVTIGCIDNEAQPVLVSRRYTGAIDDANAADLALSAFAERHDYETDDEGEVLEVTNEMDEATAKAIEMAGINISEAAEAAVKEDGVEHFIARYDSYMHDGPGGIVYWRSN